MISEHIKSLLGNELTTQLEAALKGKGKEGRDVDLVCGNDGSFVPAEKHDGEKRRAAAAEEALRTAAEAVKALGGSGEPGKLAQDIEEACQTLERMQTGHKEEIEAIRRSTALRTALSELVHDPADVMALLDDAEIAVAEDGGMTTDLTQLLRPIQERKPYLFKEQNPVQPPPLKGANPAPVGGGSPVRQYTVEEIGKLSMEEYAAYRVRQNGFPKN